MKFTDIFVRRPVLALVVSTLIFYWAHLRSVNYLFANTPCYKTQRLPLQQTTLAHHLN